MNYFRTAKLNMEQYMQVRHFQEEYVKQLMKNPLVAANVQCGQLNLALGQCVDSKGEEHQDCQELQWQMVACLSSIYVPQEFERWKTCLETHQDSEDVLARCEKESSDVMTRMGQRYEELTRGNSAERVVTPKQIERCQRECEAPTGEDDFKTFECVAPILCPAELETFLQCVDRNGKDYGAPACKSSGLAFGRCFGAAIGEIGASDSDIWAE
jgi:hypothetical protein